jgi:hypothetical protein
MSYDEALQGDERRGTYQHPNSRSRKTIHQSLEGRKDVACTIPMTTVAKMRRNRKIDRRRFDLYDDGNGGLCP